MAEVQMGHLEMASGVVSQMAGEKIRNHKVRMDLLRVKKALGSAIEEFVEVKNDLIKEYGDEVDGGVQIDPKADGYSEFLEKYNELVMSPVPEDITLVRLSERALEMFELSVDDLEILDFVGLLEEEKAPEIALVDEA